jgi:hypothetical protein
MTSLTWMKRPPQQVRLLPDHLLAAARALGSVETAAREPWDAAGGAPDIYRAAGFVKTASYADSSTRSCRAEGAFGACRQSAMLTERQL